MNTEILSALLGILGGLAAFMAILPVLDYRFRYYLVRQCYSAQIEAGALVGFRFGYTGFGLAYWPLQRTTYSNTLWMPRLHITIWSHSGQCAQYELFRIGIGRRTFGYMTRGEVSPGLEGVYDVGFFYQRHGKRRSWFAHAPKAALVILTLLTTAVFSGCAAQKNAFRSDFDSVAVTGSYGSPDGQTVGAGIKLGVRPPDKSK